MGQLVVMGAMLQCSFGVAPSTLIVTPENRVMASNLPAATIMDFIPMKNILPFGMCTSPANPTVIAALGAPMPCVPVTTPWVPGVPTTLISGKPALGNNSKCICTWGGVISINNPGQMTAQSG
jgi:hypothetical protein